MNGFRFSSVSTGDYHTKEVRGVTGLAREASLCIVGLAGLAGIAVASLVAVMRFAEQ